MSDLRKQVANAIRSGSGKIYALKEQSGLFLTYYVLPEGVSAWFPRGDEKGITHYFDVVPSPVGDNWPFAMYREVFQPGRDYVASMLVEIHRNIGPQNAQIICPRRCYGSRCPICEDMYDRQRHEKDDDKRKAIWNELKTQRRQLSWVIVRDGGEEEEKGVQLFEVAAFFMYDKLQPLIKDIRTGDITFYEDPDDGKLIKFTMKKTSGGNEYLGHEFKDRIDPRTRRKYTIEDEYLESVQKMPLDSILKVLSFDEINDIYRAKKNVEIEEDGIYIKTSKGDSKEREFSISSSSSKEDDPPFDVEDDISLEPDDDDVDLDVCPAGHEFGNDYMQFDECEDCNSRIVKGCSQQFEMLRKMKSMKRRK